MDNSNVLLENKTKDGKKVLISIKSITHVIECEDCTQVYVMGVDKPIEVRGTIDNLSLSLFYLD